MPGNEDYYRDFRVTSTEPSWEVLVYTAAYTAVCVLIGFFFKCRKKKNRSKNQNKNATDDDNEYKAPPVVPSNQDPKGQVDVSKQGDGISDQGSCTTTVIVDPSSYLCAVEDVVGNTFFDDEDSVDGSEEDALLSTADSFDSSKAYEYWQNIFVPHQYPADSFDSSKASEYWQNIFVPHEYHDDGLVTKKERANDHPPTTVNVLPTGDDYVLFEKDTSGDILKDEEAKTQPTNSRKRTRYDDAYEGMDNALRVPPPPTGTLHRHPKSNIATSFLTTMDKRRGKRMKRNSSRSLENSSLSSRLLGRVIHSPSNLEIELKEGSFKDNGNKLDETYESYEHFEDPNDVDSRSEPGFVIEKKKHLADNRPVEDTSGLGEDTYKNEMMAIYKLSGPWAFESFVGYAGSIINISLISRYMSVAEMIAYSYVWFILGAAHLIPDALYNSLYKHVNNAAALKTEEGYDKAGKYIRICIFINMFFSIPASIGVIVGMDPIMRLYGYGDNMVMLCTDYTAIAAISNFVSYTSSFITLTTDIDGHADFNAMFSLADNIVSIVLSAFVIPICRPTLFQLGLIHMAQDLVSYIVYYYFTWFRNGWHDPYKKGMKTKMTFDRPNKKAIATLLKKTVPLSLDALNDELEWLALSFFAAYLGNVESASWILLSYVWGLAGVIPYSILGAAEYRVSNQLSKGNIALARQISSTTMTLTVSTSLIGVGVMYIFRVPIIATMTNSDVLVDTLVKVMPYILVCNPMIAITTTAGYLNRALAMYQRTTKIELAITCFVTIPVAWVSTYHFGYNIGGLLAASYIGYATMGMIVLAIYMNADWEKAVRKNRKIAGVIDEPKKTAESDGV